MKLNRKVVLILALMLSVAMATTGTLAYLTDRDTVENTFTMGNVDIDVEEEFEDGASLLPGVEVEKQAGIKNVHNSSDAWVWMTVSVPEDLVDYLDLEWLAGYEGEKIDAVVQDGYISYVVKYEEQLAPGESTPKFLQSVTLTDKVDYQDGQFVVIEGGEIVAELGDLSDVNVIVDGFAMQIDGFNNVDAAYDAYMEQWAGMAGGESGAEGGAIVPDVTVSNSEELAKAIKDGNTVIGLEAGTYTMTSAAKGKTLTLVGEGADKTTIEVVPAGQGEANGQLDYSFDGATVTFEDLTIKTNSKLYAGFTRLSGTYNNCTIQNTYNLGVGTSEFNNCTFNITNEYLRVGGAYSATFNKCTFNTDGRAILVYQDGTSVAQTVTVKDCTFNATATAKTWNGIDIAAVSIDGTSGTYTVNLEGTNTVDSDFNGLWQIKTGEANVVVNE